MKEHRKSMHGGHNHAPPAGSSALQHRKSLIWALALTVTYMVAEVVGAYFTGSLALLADAAHMLTDAGGLALALTAIAFAQRPATGNKTFGYYRAEILSALLNAVVLLAVTVYILYEAYQRFRNPPEVMGLPMIVIAVVGLVVNLISMKLLSSGSSQSLNVQGAYFEVFSDMLGSLGVIVAAAIIMWTGWQIVDPIIGAGIGLFIIPRTWRLLNEAIHILLEGTPSDIDLPSLEKALLEIPGVKKVCDLHVWTVTSGMHSMSGHLVVNDLSSAADILRSARKLLKERHKIDHTTIQVEDDAMHSEETHLPF